MCDKEADVDSELWYVIDVSCSLWYGQIVKVAPQRILNEYCSVRHALVWERKEDSAVVIHRASSEEECPGREIFLV